MMDEREDYAESAGRHLAYAAEQDEYERLCEENDEDERMNLVLNDKGTTLITDHWGGKYEISAVDCADTFLQKVRLHYDGGMPENVECGEEITFTPFDWEQIKKALWLIKESLCSSQRKTIEIEGTTFYEQPEGFLPQQMYFQVKRPDGTKKDYSIRSSTLCGGHILRIQKYLQNRGGKQEDHDRIFLVEGGARNQVVFNVAVSDDIIKAVDGACHFIEFKRDCL